MPAAWKLLPVVTDYCTGCRVCIEVCENHCLEMVWDFSTLQRPGDCQSDGKCMEACPHDAIRMDWRPLSADRAQGHWRDAPPEKMPRSWLARLRGRSKR